MNTAICSVDSCDDIIGLHGAKGLCIKHYMRGRKHGDPNYVVRDTRVDRTIICSVDGCSSTIHNNRGLCLSHYMKWFRHGDALFVPKRRGYNHPMYKAWISMKQRCDNPKLPSWDRYGGRGITYDPRWSVFENFLNDMGERPKGKTLDRKDNDGNYTKDNCRWATAKQQQNNTRVNVKVTYLGETLTMAEWEVKLGFPASTMHNRIEAGWSIERVITEPLRNNKNRRVNAS